MEISRKTMVRNLKATTLPFIKKSVLGIDIGTFSIKVVELSLKNNRIKLETYGEIELADYSSTEPNHNPTIDGGALADVLHEVDARSRTGGMSIPLSSTLISFVRVPKRDEDQMHIIIPVEARKYIPIPIEKVILDWVVLEDDDRERTNTSRDSGKPVEAHLQDVMLLAIEKTTPARYARIAEIAGVHPSFYEVEFFGAILSSAPKRQIPILLVDIGATSAKLYVLNQYGTLLVAHSHPEGGAAITECITSAMKWDVKKAEQIKCEHGLHTVPTCTEQENHAMRASITAVLDGLCSEALRIINESEKSHKHTIEHVILMGGGACLPGILEYTSQRLGKKVEIAEPFSTIHIPMILADAITAVGPKFAVAIGLALRGLYE